MSEFLWATVTQVSPLRVRLDGDAAALVLTPDTLIDPAALAVADRVRVELANNRIVVLGRAGGEAWRAGDASLRYRNRIINGNFRTNQRLVASGTNLANGVYGFDRWKAAGGTTTVTFTAAPQGQPVATNAGTGQILEQIIERANMPAGQYVMSFAGGGTGRIYKSGTTPGSFAAGPILFTCDGLADVVVDVFGTAVSKVQVELGTSPSPFEEILVTEELLQCMRYYYRNQGTIANEGLAHGFVANATTFTIAMIHPVRMRAIPTFEAIAAIANYAIRVGAQFGINTLTAAASTTAMTGMLDAVVTAGGMTAGQGGILRVNIAPAWLAWSAEL